MNRIRYLAAGLLCLTGVIHMARLGIPKSDTVFDIIVVILGTIYLLVGGFLFRNIKTAYYCGAIVPLIGLVIGFWGGIVGVLKNVTAWMAFLTGIDAVIVLSCFYLIKGKRSA